MGKKKSSKEQAEQEQTELNAKRELFCRYYTQNSELFGNATLSYAEAFDYKLEDKPRSFARNGIFHSNCRGIWVAIMQDEEEKPSIGGIPQSLRDRFGDAVNDLIQPKKPQRRNR
jgi:hypothetical protein